MGRKRSELHVFFVKNAFFIWWSYSVLPGPIPGVVVERRFFIFDVVQDDKILFDS